MTPPKATLAAKSIEPLATKSIAEPSPAGFGAWNIAADALAYQIDAWQRTILLWDVWRQRANQSIEHSRHGKPPVLNFPYEILRDGRDLQRPCNYVLMKIEPGEGVVTDPEQRPFVIVDPRAGHGPGIGGFKPDSQIGYALRTGHPCYFIGFRPDPVPGQTLEDVALAEAQFIEKVSQLHPQARGKPCIIGNCQAGWAIMALGAVRPELMGPIIIAGSPLSYWAGAKGQGPMRYTGGLLGGTWLTALASDLGDGRFDGVHMVSNFEQLDPANTYWSKPYNLYSKVDTEAERYLEFEKWFGGYFLLNRQEIMGITNGLFVGNKFATGQLVSRSGYHVDLRNIRSPILIFASYGDNITPPPQALGWILDIYNSLDDIRSREQTIIYNLHHDIGHLGIFVSSKVARKETAEFIENIDLIELLPPGLYELVLEKKDKKLPNEGLLQNDYFARFERRTLDDVRSLVGSDPEEDMRFATVQRISDVNLGFYETFVGPSVRAMVDEQMAEGLRRLHPHRLRNELLSDANPAMRVVEGLAGVVRENRRPAAPDNPFLNVQAAVSQMIEGALDTYRDLRDSMYQTLFDQIYGSPLLQAVAGLKAPGARPQRLSEIIEPAYTAKVARRIERIKASVNTGGVIESFYRMLMYLGEEGLGTDERSYLMVLKMREERPAAERPPMAKVRRMIREQAALIQLDEDEAIAAVPRLLGPSKEVRRSVLDKVQLALFAAGPPNEKQRRRLSELTKLLELGEPEAVAPPPIAARGGGKS